MSKISEAKTKANIEAEKKVLTAVKAAETKSSVDRAIL